MQGYTDSVANPCLESTFAFAATLMDEVASMYRDAGARLDTWHVGADESARRSMLEAMVYPRLLAFAERAWHRAAWEAADGMDLAAAMDRSALDADFARFPNAVAHNELPRLDRAGFQYRIEVPGARITGAEAPPTLSSSAVRTVTSSGRAGREIPVSAPPPSTSSKAVLAQPQGAW